jgi:hypothetical protein
MGVQTLEHVYSEITLFGQCNEHALAANWQKYLTAKKWYEVLLRFHDTYPYDYYVQNQLAFCSGSPAPSGALVFYHNCKQSPSQLVDKEGTSTNKEFDM